MKSKWLLVFICFLVTTVFFVTTAYSGSTKINKEVTVEVENIQKITNFTSVDNMIQLLQDLDGMSGMMSSQIHIASPKELMQGMSDMKNKALEACGFWDWFLGSLTGDTHPKPGDCGGDCGEGEHSCGPKNCSCCTDSMGGNFQDFSDLVITGVLDGFLDTAQFVNTESMTKTNLQDLFLLQQMILNVKIDYVSGITNRLMQ